jgi:thiamine biosynthesis protein ThiI
MPHEHHFLCRLSGTLSTKSSSVRRRMGRKLEGNIHRALKDAGVDYTLEREWDRIFVVSAEDRTAALLARIPGIQSVRRSVRATWETIDDIVERGAELFSERVEGRSFAVRTSRVGQRDRYDFESPDVDRRLGAKLCETGAEVDLDDPEVEVGLEVHYDHVFFYAHDLPGPGGLPVGMEGRALALVSGGFDSIVAAWEVLKRGVELDFLFFNLAGPAQIRGLRTVLRSFGDRWLRSYGPTLHIVDFRPVVADIKADAPGEYWQLLLKRLMMRAGSAVADEVRAQALVTGEAVGQVSTQTLHNLSAVERGIETPILRPLVTRNKEDIIEQARQIGTHDASKSIPEFCALDGGAPMTRATPEKLDALEDHLDRDVFARLIDERDDVKLREWSQREAGDEALRIDHIPQEAAVLDIRSEDAYQQWHVEDAMHVPFDVALDQFAALPRQPDWVVCCEVGLKSELIAERMKQAGFDARSLEGGVAALRNHRR